MKRISESTTLDGDHYLAEMACVGKMDISITRLIKTKDIVGHRALSAAAFMTANMSSEPM